MVILERSFFDVDADGASGDLWGEGDVAPLFAIQGRFPDSQTLPIGKPGALSGQRAEGEESLRC